MSKKIEASAEEVDILPELAKGFNVYGIDGIFLKFKELDSKEHLPFLKRIYKEIHNATDSGYLKFSKGFLQLINYNITDFSEEVQIEHINLLLSYKTVAKIKNFTALLAQFPSLTRLDISCQIKFIANLFELAKATKNYELLKYLPILNEENVETILDKAFDIAISLKKPLILLTVASINSFTTPKSIQEKFTERLFSLADSSETLELFQESLFKILQFLGSKTDEGYYESWNPAIKSIVNLLDSLLASTDSAEKLWVLQHTFSKIATNDIITPPALKEAIINKLLDIAKSATAPWLVENILPKFIKTIDSMSTAKQISFINNLFTITHRDTLMSLLSNTKLLKSKAFEEFSKSFNTIKEKAQTSFIEALSALLDEGSDPKIVIQILQKIPGLFDKMPSSTQVEFITKLFTYSLKTQNVEILEVICDKFTSISDAAQIKFITELLRADRLSFINEKSQAIKIIAENIEDLSDEVAEKFIAELFGARSSAIKRASSIAIAKNLPKLSDAVQIKFVTELAQSKWGMLVREPLIAIIKNIQSIRDEILITLVTELFKTTNPCKEVYLGKIAAKFTVLSDAVQTKFATEFSLPLATFKKTAIIKKMADDIVEVSAKPSLDKLFSLPESDITDQLITAIVQGYCKKYPKQIFTKINDQDTVRNILSKLNTVDESTQSDLVNGFFSLYNSSSHAKILFKAILPDLARYINHHKDSSLKDLLLDKLCDIFSIFAKNPPSNFDLLKLIMPILDTLDKERIENLTKKLKGSFKIDPKLIDSFEKHDPSFKKSEAEAIKDANILNIFKQFAEKKLTPVQNKLLIYSITPKELLPKGLLMPPIFSYKGDSKIVQSFMQKIVCTKDVTETFLSKICTGLEEVVKKDIMIAAAVKASILCKSFSLYADYNPVEPKQKGSCSLDLIKIFCVAKGGIGLTVNTIVHESLHFFLHLIFGNNFDPYYKSGAEAACELKEIIAELRSDSAISHHLFRIYKEKEFVPEILAHYFGEKAAQLISSKEEASKGEYYSFTQSVKLTKWVEKYAIPAFKGFNEYFDLIFEEGLTGKAFEEMINDLRTVVSLPEPEYLLDTTSDFDSKPTYGIPDLLKLVIPDGSLESDTTTGFISEGVAGTELVGLLD